MDERGRRSNGRDRWVEGEGSFAVQRQRGELEYFPQGAGVMSMSWERTGGGDAYPHPVITEESWGIHFELMSADDDPSSFHKRKRLCW